MEVGGHKPSPIYKKRLYISLNEGLLNNMNVRQHHRRKGGHQNGEQEYCPQASTWVSVFN